MHSVSGPFWVNFCVEFEVRIKVHSFSYLVFQGPDVEKSFSPLSYLEAFVKNQLIIYFWIFSLTLLYINLYVYHVSTTLFYTVSWSVWDMFCSHLKLFRPSKSFSLPCPWNCFILNLFLFVLITPKTEF